MQWSLSILRRLSREVIAPPRPPEARLKSSKPGFRQSSHLQLEQEGDLIPCGTTADEIFFWNWFLKRTSSYDSFAYFHFLALLHFCGWSCFSSRACKNVNVGRVNRSSGIISDNMLMIVDINPCELWPVCHPICWSRHARPGAASATCRASAAASCRREVVQTVPLVTASGAGSC